MPHVIRKDSHGPYIRCNGHVFRPLFPKDYPYHRNDTSLAVGTQIDCEHQVDTPLVVIKAGKRITVIKTCLQFLQYKARLFLKSKLLYIAFVR